MKTGINWRVVALVSLVWVSVSPLAVAESQRYPSETELQQLIQDFQRQVARLRRIRHETGFYLDRRSPLERQQHQAFVQAWGKVDPAVAPFLGNWTAIEESLMIYPSQTKGQVCIIETFIPDQETSGIAFTTGTIDQGRIYTRDRKVFVLDGVGDFLGSAYVYEGKPGIYEYANPRPLPNPQATDYLQREPSLLMQFQQLGCQATVPRL